MSEFFFEMPSFLRGAARSIDLGATLGSGSYLLSDTPAEANARALASDWSAVHRALRAAASRLADEPKEK